MKDSRSISVWFYIGSLLLVYGIIILGAGIYQIFHPPQTVLSNYHATFWGGVCLSILGGIYAYYFRPQRRM